jgi:hypothetical protein
MVHLGAALIEIRREPADLLHVDIRCRRNGVNAESRVFGLEFLQSIVRFHSLLEGIPRDTERIVELGHAVE